MMNSMGFIYLVLILPFSIGALGPPPGSRGTIDFRYPDIIVDPRPPCESEGVFPHPRNCSWFYRCYDTFGIGVYRQAYFECGPGTVFFDELDQCVYPSGVSVDCDGGTRPNVTTPPTTQVSIVITTDPPTTIPPATEPPSTTPDYDDCYVSMITCRDYLCPDANGNMVESGSICPIAYRECGDNPDKIDICVTPLYFALLTGDCVQSPESRGCKEIVEVPPTTPSTTSTTTTTTTTTPAPQDCFDTMEGCRDYVCPAEGGGTTREHSCQSAFEVCNDDTVTFYCHDTHHFMPNKKQCVLPPEQRGCFSETLTGTVNINIFVECSFEEPRPLSPKFNEYFCKNYKLCQRGLRNTEAELCSSYLQCARANDEWVVNTLKCSSGQLFSYAVDNCVTEPPEDC